MSGPQITATIIARDPRLFERDHRRYIRFAFTHSAIYHHQNHIPRHFMPFASRKYGYAKRRSQVWVGIFERIGLFPWREGEKRRQPYQAMKDRLGLPPLVFTGASRDLATSQRQVSATPKGAKLTIRLALKGASGSFRFKRGQKELTQQQKEVVARISELETISDDEQRTLNTLIQRVYTREANYEGNKYRKRILG